MCNKEKSGLVGPWSPFPDPASHWAWLNAMERNGWAASNLHDLHSNVSAYRSLSLNSGFGVSASFWAWPSKEILAPFKVLHFMLMWWFHEIIVLPWQSVSVDWAWHVSVGGGLLENLYDVIVFLLAVVVVGTVLPCGYCISYWSISPWFSNEFSRFLKYQTHSLFFARPGGGENGGRDLITLFIVPLLATSCCHVRKPKKHCLHYLPIQRSVEIVWVSMQGGCCLWQKLILCF